MRARALTAGVAVLLLAGLLAAAAGAPLDFDVQLVHALGLTPITATPPPLALRRLSDNRTVALGELRGRPVLLYFWATW
jgi:hypothetical protein